MAKCKALNGGEWVNDWLLVQITVNLDRWDEQMVQNSQFSYAQFPKWRKWHPLANHIVVIIDQDVW